MPWQRQSSGTKPDAQVRITVINTLNAFFFLYKTLSSLSAGPLSFCYLSTSVFNTLIDKKRGRAPGWLSWLSFQLQVGFGSGHDLMVGGFESLNGLAGV